MFLEHVGKGMYADQITVWFSLFRPEQFVFVTLDEMKRVPELAVGRVLTFLGLDGPMEPEVARSSRHVYNQRRTGVVFRDNNDAVVARASKSAAAEPVEREVKRRYFARKDEVGMNVCGNMSRREQEKVVQKLRSFYAPHDRELFKLLGRRLWTIPE